MSDGSPEVHYLPEVGSATACGKDRPGLHYRQSWDGVTCAACILTRPRTPPTAPELLARAAGRLQATTDAVEADLLARYASEPAAPLPDVARDAEGRYILLDARTALVDALTALTIATRR